MTSLENELIGEGIQQIEETVILRNSDIEISDIQKLRDTTSGV